MALCSYGLVTSLAEVWIEIKVAQEEVSSTIVTSLAEVWIEIKAGIGQALDYVSLPLRKCGLK